MSSCWFCREGGAHVSREAALRAVATIDGYGASAQSDDALAIRSATSELSALLLFPREGACPGGEQ